MMSYENDQPIQLERSGSVATVLLNRPRRLNGLDPTMVDALIRTIDELERCSSIRCVIVTGQGRAFSAGGDLRSPLFSARTHEERAAIIEPGYELTRRLRHTRLPLIAAINGVCAGAGVLLACLCDLRIAADNARFSLDHVKVGLLPDMGLTHLLPKIIGHTWATRLTLTGEPIDAERARAIGLISEVVAPEALMPTAVELADRLVGLPPLAVAAVKREIRDAPDRSLEEALRHEAEILNHLVATDDCAEAIDAFIHQQQAVFRGA